MTMKIRMGIASTALVMVLGLIALSDRSYGSGEKDLRPEVIKIAELMKKGDMDGAKKLAKKVADQFEDNTDLMHMYRTNKAGGMGFGPERGKNPAIDGLEKKLKELEKGVPTTFAKESANYEAAGYWMAALAELTLVKTPKSDMGGGKTKKAWADWSKELRDASVDFAKASSTKNEKALKTASDKISGLCLNCHSKFK